MSEQDQNQPMTAEQAQNTQAQAQSVPPQMPPQAPPSQNTGANADQASGQVSEGEVVTSSVQQRKQMQIIYICFIIGFFIGFMAIAGVIMAYIRRNDMYGTVYASHASFVIKTFWVSLISFIISVILMFVFIGYFTMLLTAIWIVVRIISGLIKCINGKPASSGWLMA